MPFVPNSHSVLCSLPWRFWPRKFTWEQRPSSAAAKPTTRLPSARLPLLRHSPRSEMGQLDHCARCSMVWLCLRDLEAGRISQSSVLPGGLSEFFVRHRASWRTRRNQGGGVGVWENVVVVMVVVVAAAVVVVAAAAKILSKATSQLNKHNVIVRSMLTCISIDHTDFFCLRQGPKGYFSSFSCSQSLSIGRPGLDFPPIRQRWFGGSSRGDDL